MEKKRINFGRTADNLLTYGNQLKFKKYFFYITKRNGIDFKEDFYFDDIDCVDETTSMDIESVKLDSNLFWGEAVINILRHFNYNI